MATAVTFLLFTAFVAVVSWYKTKGDDHESSDGYFLAGRSLGWVVIAGSLLLTNLSTEQLVGMNGGGFQHGMQLMAWEVWSAIAIVLMALVFLPRYLKGGVATVSEFLDRRYDRGVGTLVSVLLLLSLLTNLLPFVLYSGALFIEEAFDIHSVLGISQSAAVTRTVVVLGVIGSLYAIFGGLKAVAVSDTVNGIGLLVGGAIVPIYGLMAVARKYGGEGVIDGITHITSNHSQMLNPVDLQETANVPFSTLFTGMLFITTYYWCTNQAIVQRTFGAKSLAEGQKGVLFAAFMKLLAPLYVVLPGIIAFHLFAVYSGPDQQGVVEAVTAEESVILQPVDAAQGSELLVPINELVTKLPKDSSGDVTGKVVKHSDADYIVKAAVPADKIVLKDDDGLSIVEGSANAGDYLGRTQGDKSYGKLAKAVVPESLLGFFAAVIFGAILSSFNSGLNSAATLFSVDIYQKLFKKNATEKQMVRFGKIVGVVLAIGAISVAPLIEGADSLFDLMKKLAAFYNIPLLAIVMVGMFSRRASSGAAWLAVLCGIAFYGYFGFYRDNTIFGVQLHWLHIAGMNFILLVSVMLLSAKIAPRAVAWEQTYTEDVDITPWKYATPVGALILVLIATMYAAMSLL